VSFVSDVSDWAILNDAKSKQLQRILVEFHHQSASEVYRACVLLESYHSVYRRDRIEQRRNQIASGQARIKEPCVPPTPTQLHEIAQRMNANAALSIPTEEVMIQLQELAKYLRQYQIDVKAGLKKILAKDDGKHRLICDRIHFSDFTNHWSNLNEPIPCLSLPNGRIQSSSYELPQSQKKGRCCGR
jgi:hypothetical protein